MALKKGRVAIPLSKGINQKIDPKQDPPGSLKELDNIQVAKFGEIEKQDGFEKVQDSYGYLGSTTEYNIENIKAITSLKDDLYILTDNHAYSNNPGLDKAIFEGKYLPASLKTEELTQDPFVHNNPNSIVIGDYLYTVYNRVISSTPYIYIEIKNINDGTYALTSSNIEAFNPSGTQQSYKPRMVLYYGHLRIFAYTYDSSTAAYTISYISADPLDYNVITSSTTVRSYLCTGGTAATYDVAVSADEKHLLLSFSTSSNTLLHFMYSGVDPNNYLDHWKSIASTQGAVKWIDSTTSPMQAYRSGVAEDDPGSNCFWVSCITTSGTGGVGLDIVDPSRAKIIGNTNTYPTGFDDATAVAVTGTPRYNNFEEPTRAAWVFESYAEIQLDGGTTTFQQIPYIDNKTGTRAASYLVAANFGGSGVVKTGASTGSTTGLSDVALADFPKWAKTKIQRSRSYFTVTNTEYGSPASYGETVQYGCSLISKPYLQNGEPILPLGRTSTLQSSYFLTNNSDYDSGINRAVGLIGYGVAESDYIYTNHVNGLPSFSRIPDYSTKKILPGLRKTRTKSNNETFFTVANASHTTIDYSADIANQSEIISDNLLVAGAQLYAGDQVRFYEHGFLYNPDELFVLTTNMSQGGASIFTTPNTYNWVAIFTYEDGSGNKHRSGISKQLSMPLSGGTGWDHVDILVPMLNTTAKYELATTVELYRTIGDGTIFYKVSEQNAALTYPIPYNNKENFFILVRDDVPDGELQDNEILYTTGGVLENTPVGACQMVANYHNRIFLGGLENNPDLLYYSKITTGANIPAEFNDTLNLEIPKEGGNLKSLKKMDDKLIIFKERSIYMITGEGPNNLGQQNNFIEPQLISSDLGCKFANSVVFMPKGLMFMSQKGIYLLNRSLGLEYIGAAAEDYNHLTIVKAVTVPTKDEVRFQANDGPTIVYNYFLNMWYTSSVQRGVSSVLVKDDFYLATVKDEVFKQVSTTSSFGGSMVPIKLETAWLSFAGIQGFQRVYRMLILGEYKSPHKLQIKIAYNYDDVWKEEKIIDVTGYTESYSYGSPITGTDAAYGSPSGDSNRIAYGGKDNTQYQIRLNFAKQKCEAIKIQILELEGSNTDHTGNNPESAGPGFDLSNLSFVVGLKDGDYRIKQGRTFGSTSIT
jgi:hypothetical protein